MAVTVADKHRADNDWQGNLPGYLSEVPPCLRTHAALGFHSDVVVHYRFFPVISGMAEIYSSLALGLVRRGSREICTEASAC